MVYMSYLTLEEARCEALKMTEFYNPEGISIKRIKNKDSKNPVQIKNPELDKIENWKSTGSYPGLRIEYFGINKKFFNETEKLLSQEYTEVRASDEDREKGIWFKRIKISERPDLKDYIFLYQSWRPVDDLKHWVDLDGETYVYEVVCRDQYRYEYGSNFFIEDRFKEEVIKLLSKLRDEYSFMAEQDINHKCKYLGKMFYELSGIDKELKIGQECVILVENKQKVATVIEAFYSNQLRKYSYQYELKD